MRTIGGSSRSDSERISDSRERRSASSSARANSPEPGRSFAMSMAIAASLVLGYLSGALPWGLWLGRWVKGVDVRTLGSRNLGATNVYRSLGPALGITTLLLDIAKGALPVGVVPGLDLTRDFPGGREWCMVAVAIAAVSGHVWTCFAGFRGGKGV